MRVMCGPNLSGPDWEHLEMKSTEDRLAPRTAGISLPSARHAGPVWRQVWAALAGSLKRGWWLFALVVITVSALSLAQYLRGPRLYQTSQSFYILVSPIGASTSYDNYQASVWAETIGHALAEGRLTMVSSDFAPAINAALAKEPGKSSPHDLSPSQLQRYLSWSNSGNMVVVTAGWTSPEGASALLQATSTAVEAGDLRHVTIWRGALPSQLVAHIIAAAPATPSELVVSQQSAAQQLMLERITLGILAGLLLIPAWAWVERLAGRPSPAEESDQANGSK